MMSFKGYKFGNLRVASVLISVSLLFEVLSKVVVVSVVSCFFVLCYVVLASLRLFFFFYFFFLFIFFLLFILFAALSLFVFSSSFYFVLILCVFSNLLRRITRRVTVRVHTFAKAFIGVLGIFRSTFMTVVVV